MYMVSLCDAVEKIGNSERMQVGQFKSVYIGSRQFEMSCALAHACVCLSESERVKTIREQCKPAPVLKSVTFCGACRHFYVSADSVSGVLSVLVLPAL